LTPGLEWVSATISSKILLSELKDAVRRISDLMAAVRSYSQMDRASAQRTDVRDGLESTLTMLGHKLKGGVTLEREYTDLPAIEAYAGELNQVWTNLIDNARPMDSQRHSPGTARRVGRGGRSPTPARACRRRWGASFPAVLHDQGRRQGHRTRSTSPIGSW
jgi:nitrogen-specific signal transduction histidine kinase